MQAVPVHRKATIVVTLLALFFAAIAAFGSASAEAAPAGGEQAKPPKLFATEAPMTLKLTGPWRELMRDKASKKRYKGTLEYVDDAGSKRTMPVAFEARGHNRLKVCKACRSRPISSRRSASRRQWAAGSPRPKTNSRQATS